jgi:hypothetical protein
MKIAVGRGLLFSQSTLRNDMNGNGNTICCEVCDKACSQSSSDAIDRWTKASTFQPIDHQY